MAVLQNSIREQTTNFVYQAVGQAALGNVAVRAVVAALFFERGALDFGIDDYAQGRVCATEFPSGLQAIEARHPKIKEREIGLMLRDKLDGVYAIAGGADNFEAAREIEVVADGTKGSG